MIILRAGTFGGRTVTEADLDRIAANTRGPVAVSLDSGARVGSAGNFRREGDALVADFLGVMDVGCSALIGYDPDGPRDILGVRLFPRPAFAASPAAALDLTDEPTVVEG